MISSLNNVNIIKPSVTMTLCYDNYWQFLNSFAVQCFQALSQGAIYRHCLSSIKKSPSWQIHCSNIQPQVSWPKIKYSYYYMFAYMWVVYGMKNFKKQKSDVCLLGQILRSELGWELFSNLSLIFHKNTY